MGWILFGALVILAIVFSAVSLAAEQKRKKLLCSVAGSLGLGWFPNGLGGSEQSDFAPSWFPTANEADAVFLARFDGFSVFKRAGTVTVSELMIGRRDVRDWYCFRCTWTEKSGRNKKQVSYSVVAVRCALLFKHLMIQPHTWIDSLGVHAIKFESAEFNDRYLVQSDDLKFAYDLLHPEAMELLLKWKLKHLEFFGCYFMTFAPNFAPNEVYEAVLDMEAFLETIPEYLVQDIGFQAYWPSPYDP